MGFPIGGQFEPTVYVARFLLQSFKGIGVTTLIFRRSAHVKGQKVDRLGKKESNKHRMFHIFTQKPQPPAASIVTKFVLGADFQDVINCAKFHSNPFRGFDFVGGRILAFPIGRRCRR